MINMKRYAGGKTPYELFTEAVNRKDQNSADTKLLQANKMAIGAAYRFYGCAMQNRKIDLLTPSSVLALIKDPLLSMYSNDCKLVKDFRTWHFNNNLQTYNNVCPYCTINSANTTEHILPKEDFPEYSVDVYNLIPACSECNSYKGKFLRDESGKFFTINFYTDILPNVRFLFATIKPIVGGVQFEYCLSNTNGVDPELFALIERHFVRYKLISRFYDKAVQELPNLVNYFRSEEITSEEEFDKVAQKLIRKTDLDAPSYGLNHWKIVMNYEAASSPVFKAYILSLLGI